MRHLHSLSHLPLAVVSGNYTSNPPGSHGKTDLARQLHMQASHSPVDCIASDDRRPACATAAMATRTPTEGKAQMANDTRSLLKSMRTDY
jgi:hypothetical protein